MSTKETEIPENNTGANDQQQKCDCQKWMNEDPNTNASCGICRPINDYTDFEKDKRYTDLLDEEFTRPYDQNCEKAAIKRYFIELLKEKDKEIAGISSELKEDRVSLTSYRELYRESKATIEKLNKIISMSVKHFEAIKDWDEDSEQYWEDQGECSKDCLRMIKMDLEQLKLPSNGNR